MHRRELFRLLSAAAVAPVLTPDFLTLLRQAQPSAEYKIRTFSAHQNDMVIAMIDLTIPATDTPGAKGARVNEFMDVILTDWATPQERTEFLKGLDDVDAQSSTLFGKTFLQVTPAQQTALLRSLDDAVDWHRSDPREPVPRERRDSELRGEFFRVFKRMTIHGYYTSEIGFTQELKLEIIPGAQHGCVPVTPEKEA
ncbi:MAG: gluconate 2-dehydrogenase subunit 3 family protein [Candidatus Acidiferrum sp.]